jgi:hypothetical protein
MRELYARISQEPRRREAEAIPNQGQLRVKNGFKQPAGAPQPGWMVIRRQFSHCITC